MIGRNLLNKMGMRTFNSKISKSIATPIAHHLSTSDYGSQDMAFNKDRIIKKEGEANQRDFTYFLLGGGRFIYASAARLALIKVSLYITFYFVFFSLCNLFLNSI